MILCSPYNTIQYNGRLNRTVQDHSGLYRIERAPANKVLFAGGPPANKKLFAGGPTANKKLFAGGLSANKTLFAGALSILYSPEWSCTVLFSLPLYCMVL